MKNMILNRFKWGFLFILIFNAASGKIPAGMFPEIKGWQLTEEPKVYTPDNLWDLIDGAADGFLSYGFQDLHIAEYSDDKDQKVRVELYRQSSPVNAFGIYASERMPDYNFIQLGVQGYTSQDVLIFFTGDFYVKIMASGTTGIPEDKLVYIGEQINNYLGIESKWPEELSVFPETGKLKNGENYIAKNFLGYQFLQSAFTAEYKGEKKNYKLFIMHSPDSDQARETLKKYFKQVKFTYSDISDKNYAVEDPYNGKIYIGLAGSYILGVMNMDDQKTAITDLDQIRERIPK